MTVKCNKCKEEINKEDLEKNYYICPLCGKLNRMPAKNRLQMLTEKFDVMFNDQEFTDPIDFPSYKEKYESAREKSGETEGVVCGRGTIGGNDTCIFIMEPNFMMGSMGTVVGDRITALFEYATKNRLPVIGYTVSGGARMQEGALSLMQMAKVSAAAKRHSDAGLLYVVCTTDPTMGGATASFAMLGDIIISEPGAMIGFAGKRVVAPPIVGSVVHTTYKSPASLCLLAAAETLAICISDSAPSCILAPPETVYPITGSLFFVAYSKSAVILSPTTVPIEPIMKLGSIMNIHVSFPPIVPLPHTTPSVSPLFSLADSYFSLYDGKSIGSVNS
jgi:acetyl-CoA carboxylase carboxyl transferase subunit beta